MKSSSSSSSLVGVLLLVVPEFLSRCYCCCFSQWRLSFSIFFPLSFSLSLFINTKNYYILLLLCIIKQTTTTRRRRRRRRRRGYSVFDVDILFSLRDVGGAPAIDDDGKVNVDESLWTGDGMNTFHFSLWPRKKGNKKMYEYKISGTSKSHSSTQNFGRLKNQISHNARSLISHSHTLSHSLSLSLSLLP